MIRPDVWQNVCSSGLVLFFLCVCFMYKILEWDVEYVPQRGHNKPSAEQHVTLLDHRNKRCWMGTEWQMHYADWWNQRRGRPNLRRRRRVCTVCVWVCVCERERESDREGGLNYLWREKNNQICGFSGAWKQHPETPLFSCSVTWNSNKPVSTMKHTQIHVYTQDIQDTHTHTCIHLQLILKVFLIYLVCHWHNTVGECISF